MYGVDLNDWFCHERDWRDLIDLIDGLPSGKRYFAALQEDEELARARAANYQPPEPAEAPSFREFTAERYDYARIIALLEHILAGIYRTDSNAQPYVPVPAVERIADEIAFDHLLSIAARGLGEEI